MNDLEVYEGMKSLPNSGGVHTVQHGDDNDVPVRFFQKAVQNKFRSKQENRPIFEDKDFIRIFYVGSRDYLDREATEQDKRRFSRQWEAYQKQEKHSWQGTPLASYPGMTEAMKNTLEYYHVYTVEGLVSSSDATLDQVGMGARELQKNAKAWVEHAKENKEDEEKKQMREQIEKLTNTVAELSRRGNKSQPKTKGKSKEVDVLEELNVAIDDDSEGGG